MPRPPVHMIKIDRDARDQALPLGASGARLQRPNKGCNFDPCRLPAPRIRFSAMAVSDGLPGKEKRAERAAAGSCPIGNGAVTSAVLVHLRVEPAHFVVKAMTNVSSATPTSFDGAVAMVKFV